jgi:hypothetical protein
VAWRADACGASTTEKGIFQALVTAYHRAVPGTPDTTKSGCHALVPVNLHMSFDIIQTLIQIPALPVLLPASRSRNIMPRHDLRFSSTSMLVSALAVLDKPQCRTAVKSETHRLGTFYQHTAESTQQKYAREGRSER